MTKMLPEVKSDYALEIIEKQKVKDARFKVYIKDLAKIEDIVSSGGPRSFREGINFYFLRTRYKEEYRKILRELNPQKKYASTVIDTEKLK